MSVSTAQVAIASVLQRDDQFSDTTIELIGGETLIEWTRITEVIEWTIARRQDWKKNFAFFIDTNGTLLNDERKSWLRARREFVTMGLSLDGAPDAHNLNRSNSYAHISPHLDFFAELWPHQTVKMTIAPATVRHVFESTIDIMRHGLRVAANFPLEDIWGTPTEKATCVDEFRKQVDDLVEFFGEHCNLPLPSLINLPIHMLLVYEERDRPWCGSGRSMSAVDTDGLWLPCNRYARMSFDRALFGCIVSESDSRCNSCFFRPACQTCEAHNWESTGNPNVRTSFHCEFVKLQIWGTARVHAYRLKRIADVFNFAARSPRSSDLDIPKAEQLLRFVSSHSEVVRRVLEVFEQAPTLDAAGIDWYGDDRFRPLQTAIWTMPLIGTFAEAGARAATTPRTCA